jgi:hypothetical protein
MNGESPVKSKRFPNYITDMFGPMNISIECDQTRLNEKFVSLCGKESCGARFLPFVTRRDVRK